MSSRWQPGCPSPNPGGRPKSATLVARAIAERTNGGAEIVEAVLRIARGEDKTITSERSRTWSWEWLADRLWGRPAQSLELVAPDTARGPRAIPLDDLDLSADELRAIVEANDTIDRIVSKARATTLRKMPFAQLQQVAIDEAVAAGETEQEVRERFRRESEALRKMPLAKLERIAAGETDETTTDTDGDTDDAA